MIDKNLETFAISFIENHFNEIDLYKTDWNVETKEQAIESVRNNVIMIEWIISEVMSWGTPIDYTKDLIVDDDDMFIIKINNRYYQYNGEIYEEVFPETIMIEKVIYTRKCNGKK